MKWYLIFCMSLLMAACQTTPIISSGNKPATPTVTKPEITQPDVVVEEVKTKTIEEIQTTKEVIVNEPEQSYSESLWGRPPPTVEPVTKPQPPKPEIPDVAVVKEPEPDSNDSSWWDKTKGSTADLWNKTKESVGGYVGLETGPAAPDKEATQQAGRNPYFGQIWQGVTPRINKVLALEEKRKTLPETSWLGESKKSTQSELDELLDEAVEILSLSESNQIREKIRGLEQDIETLKSNIADYRQAQVGAPLDSTWKTTVDGYDKKIKSAKEQIAYKEQQITNLQTEFGRSLEKIGIRLSQEQLDVLFSSVVGDDIIQASLVYENVKLVNEQLMKLTISSEEDFTISKRYYGMHVVLVKILYHMQDSFIQDVDNKYVPKIAEIEKEVQTIKASTQSLLRREHDPKRREHLTANLEAQELTLKTADLYEEHLLNQREKMVAAREKTFGDLQVAENTYATVTVSSELVGLLRTSQKAFEVLQNMQTPDLLIFENLQMKQEFAVLTDKLNQ
ncbi:hypothetical protein [Candidatus Albibeggiatoa sp. nov. NOAA]|uniref:hypothetical protein n=1 Tax=Candidatus Albibeggiatoa sp. nov. NOAA TaxID=3162724 RepID=UPI0032F24AF9|nr:hypothetical protein [Thiotrichaceae bacterium]